MSSCYVIAREGVSGGTGSLSFRLLNYLHNHGFHCAYLCCINNSPQMMSMISNVADKVVVEDDNSYKTQFDKICQDYASFVFLTYSIDEYLKVDKLRKHYPSIVRSVLYVVHGYAFSMPPQVKMASLKRLILSITIRLRYKKVVKFMLACNSIIFMDEMSVKETEKSLNLSINKSLIHYLPIDVKDYSDDFWRKGVCRHDPFTIGTMCRMEIPFKGYVLGLVDQFSALQEKYSIKLLIVGDGPNADELIRKLSSLPQDVKDKIEYKSYVAYSDLDFFYCQCDLTVGMGTVLMDAANHNVLALPVKSYTREFEVGPFFKDEIDTILYEGNKYYDFDKMLEELINLSDEDFTEMIHEQYIKFRECYGIDNFVNLLTKDSLGSNELPINARNIYDLFIQIYRLYNYLKRR